jgi:predicted O-methyltransferase YrrM
MKHLNLSPDLYNYMLDVSLHEHPVLAALRQQTSTMQLAAMQISPEQAQFMQLLIRLLKANRVLELGTFTGYSALAMALALPDNGRLITCDINTEWTSRAPSFWEAAGQAHKIDLRIAPAKETLHQLINDGYTHQFDFIFIDADKTNYLTYYELALQLVSPNGLIAIDNVFWEGKVIDSKEIGAQTREIRKLNQKIKQDPRVFVSLLPIADGLFLVQPRGELFPN